MQNQWQIFSKLNQAHAMISQIRTNWNQLASIAEHIQTKNCNNHCDHLQHFLTIKSSSHLLANAFFKLIQSQAPDLKLGNYVRYYISDLTNENEEDCFATSYYLIDLTNLTVLDYYILIEAQALQSLVTFVKANPRCLDYLGLISFDDLSQYQQKYQFYQPHDLTTLNQQWFSSLAKKYQVKSPDQQFLNWIINNLEIYCYLTLNDNFSHLLKTKTDLILNPENSEVQLVSESENDSVAIVSPKVIYEEN